MRVLVWIAVGQLALGAGRASAEPPDPRDELPWSDEVDVTADVVAPYLSESSDALALLAQAEDPPAVPTGIEPGLYGEPAQPPAAETPAPGVEPSPVPAEPPPSAAEPSGAPEGAQSAPAPKQVPEGKPKPDPVFAEWGAPGADAVPIEPRIHAAVLFGVGASFDETPGGVNPLGFGFGLRGDYRLLPQLAVGARFVYFVGGSAALPAGDISMASWLLAAEAAYRFPINGLLLEPGVALGVSARSVDGRAPFVDGRAGGFVTGTEDRTEAGFYLAPGASLVVPLAVFSPDLEPFFVGGDARIGFVFGDEVSGSFELMVQAGLRF